MPDTAESGRAVVDGQVVGLRPWSARLDLGEPASVAELFTPDSAWEWPAGGRRAAGREAR